MKQEDLKKYILDSKINNLIEATKIGLNGVIIQAQARNIVSILDFLHDDENLQCKILIDIFGNDHPDKQARFEVMYNLLSMKYNFRIIVKVYISEEEKIPTVTHLFDSALWYEREVWDMYGVEFKDNPDLRRILTDYGFEGHPLRKDFPLTGYVEVRYDPEQQKVIYEPVELMQDFRKFDFVSPWEGTEYILPGDEKGSK